MVAPERRWRLREEVGCSPSWVSPRREGVRGDDRRLPAQCRWHTASQRTRHAPEQTTRLGNTLPSARLKRPPSKRVHIVHRTAAVRHDEWDDRDGAEALLTKDRALTYCHLQIFALARQLRRLRHSNRSIGVGFSAQLTSGHVDAADLSPTRRDVPPGASASCDVPAGRVSSDARSYPSAQGGARHAAARWNAPQRPGGAPLALCAGRVGSRAWSACN